MELNLNVTEYQNKKDGVNGYTTLKKPYICFTYPKSIEQIEEETKRLSKDGKHKQAKLIRPYILCYFTLDNKDDLKLVTEFDKIYDEQRFRFKLRPNDITISINGVKRYLKTNKYPSSTELHKRIVTEIKKYCFLKEDETYDIIAIYIMLTYKYKFLDFTPILHLNGEAGTGKSQIIKICSKLGFNSSTTVSTTSSSFFRRIDRKRGLYCMDEKEKLEDYEKELLNGCTYEGNIHTVTEKVNDEFVDTDFQIYTPVILACISEIYGATSTRTIKIETVKPPRKYKKYPIIKLTENKVEWENLRDDLCIWSMKTYKETNSLMNVSQEMEDLLNNRGVDTWKNILNQAKLNGVYEKIISYINYYYLEQIEELSDNDTNFNFIKFIYNLGDTGFMPISYIYQEFSNYNLTDKQKEFFNITRCGRLLRRMGYDKKSENKKRTEKGFEYKFEKEHSAKFIKNNYDFTNEILEKLDELITEETIMPGSLFCEVATCLYCKKTKLNVRLSDMKCKECYEILDIQVKT